ncbi:MAG: XisI protein [Chloroflexota bacterium]
MDTTTIYRDVVEQTILQYARLRPSHGNIRLEALLDETRDRYALMEVGWDRGRRVSGDLLYVTLRDGKVFIEYDGIGYGITDDLIARGIPEEDIVLAFLPEAEITATNGAKPRPSQTNGIRAAVPQGV